MAGRTPQLRALCVAVTAFTALLIPVYWRTYGPGNFLWFSDIALFLTVALLWREDRLINSMLVLGVLPFELIWNLGFFGRLFTGHHMFGLTAYMFDGAQPLFLRSLSLFHVALPLIWLRLLYAWGYDPRAVRYQTAVFAAAVLLAYFLTDPAENVNWVFTPEVTELWSFVPTPVWILCQVTLIPTIVYLPLHALLKRRFPPKSQVESAQPALSPSAP